jgi:NADPH-dependent 2,4-dienoyl-CoA reductase/sulfur reductase-like enzyme
MRRVVVVGAGLAGLAAVRALRELGYDGDVEVVGSEPDAPYDRPPLSKGFLTGAVEPSALALAGPEELDGLGATWRLGRTATGLDPSDRAVVLDDGSRLVTDGVVVATGSRARLLPELAGVAGAHVLRTLHDAEALRSALAGCGHLLVLGGGFVGAEVASSARQLGVEVTVVEAEPVLLRRQFGTDAAPVWERLHRDHGVTTRLRVTVEEWWVRGTEGGRRIAGATLTDGTRVPAGAVLLALGSEPNTGWLRGSGLVLDGGLVCDAVGRTALPQVVGAGDVVRAPNAFVGAPIRVEHWTHALQQPVLAATALLGGDPVAPTAPPYVWSDQHDARIQFAGHRDDGDSMRVVAGDVGGLRFTAVFERAGRPVAALSVSQPREFGRWRRSLVGAHEADPRPVA